MLQLKYASKMKTLHNSYVAIDINIGDYFQHNYNPINYGEKVNCLIVKMKNGKNKD